MPSVAIPYGQRFITVTLGSKDDMIGIQTRGSGTSGNSITTPNISTISLYINNIFVNPEIHKIFIKRIGFTLIRVHRQQVISTALAEQEILLQALKWPIETLFVGLRPTSQKTDLAYWTKFAKITETAFNMPNLVTKASTFAGVTATIAATGAAYPVTVTPTYVQATCKAPVVAKTIDRLTLSAHGIYLYNDIPADFFNAYTPYTYGGVNIRTPDDEGALMVPFNLYPGTYQPSSHVNVSRAREFYLKYTSSVISSGTPGEVVVLGSAINFLLISDGSAVLRYST